MKANELRIGNLVLNNGARIIDAHDIVMCERNSDSFNNLNSPIPLTEEWLLKFGFEKLNRDVIAFEKGNLIVEWLFERWTGRLYFDAYTSIQIIETKYVHQLQNLYFALTGEELKIND